MMSFPLWILTGWAGLSVAQSLEVAMVDAAGAGIAANVRHYLERGVDPDVRVVGDDGCVARTALARAIASGRGEVVLVLLDSGADPDARGSDGRSPLVLAVEHGEEEIASYLIEAGANVNAALGGPYGAYMHPLSSIRNNVAMLALLVEAGADVNVRFFDADTPLHRAVEGSSIDVVRLLLSAGASVDVVNLAGATPLMVAVRQGRTELVPVLIDAGADVNARAVAETPLIAAVDSGTDELVTTLLAAGARINERGWMGQSALIRAVKNARLERVQLLVEAGADVNLRDDTGLTALDWARYCEREDVVGYLTTVGSP